MKFKSGYSNSLTGADRARYEALIKLCNNLDPYEIDLSITSDSADLIPPVNVVHILQYLVHTTKAYSMSQMMSYKGTEAHKFATNGWIQLLRFLPVDSDKTLCFAKVKHSYSFSLTCLHSWCLVKKNGDVLGGWCDCVAGRSESCSHVGAILYALEIGSSLKEKQTCTSRPCAWLPPSLKEVPPAQIKDIDYTPSIVKRRRLVEEDEVDDPSNFVPVNSRPVMTGDETNRFLQEIHDCFPEAALFRVVAQYADEYAVPKIDLPFPLSDLFHVSNCSLSLSELELKAKEVFSEGKVKISLEQTRLIEKKTRKQSLTKIWNLMRTGLITASVMYTALHTNLQDPSITFIKNCCYPFDNKFVSYWMKRGLKLEPEIRGLYIREMKKNHQDVKVVTCGLMRSLEAPWIAASPDGVVFCSCCGWGLVEMKAPKYPNERPDYVRPEHYYQIQTQLFCIGTKYQYCDYVVYHPKKTTIKRVNADVPLQDEIVEKSKVVFLKLILPELLGRYYSSLKHIVSNQTNEKVVCYCQKRERPPMIKCVGVNCTFTLFHASCVGVRRATSNWICPQCKG